VANDVNNIGSVLSSQGDEAGALANYKTAFRITLRAFGPRGANVATGAGNIASVGGDWEAVAREALKDKTPSEIDAALRRSGGC
jgi:hypothetical protein